MQPKLWMLAFAAAFAVSACAEGNFGGGAGNFASPGVGLDPDEDEDLDENETAGSPAEEL